MSRFIVFDVEKPNRLNHRMSAIDITVIEDGAITEGFYSLVNPETHFDYFNTQLTGINEETVRDAPTFPELWIKIESLMSSGILVAHNAVFDMSVLKKRLNGYDIFWKQSAKYLCMVQMGRQVLPGMSHKLNVLCDYYGIYLDRHNAASSSQACAEILLRYIVVGTDIKQYIRTHSLSERRPKFARKRGDLLCTTYGIHGMVAKKCSEGCQNCCMYYLDSLRGKDGGEIYRTKAGFNYPLSKDRRGQYKVKNGEMIRVCMTSDSFFEEANPWRDEAWAIIKQHLDVRFFLLTKRSQWVASHLPWDWDDGWENVMCNVTCENQQRADERIPMMLELSVKHRGIMCAPLVGSVSIAKHLPSGQIEQVLCDGEIYGGACPCYYECMKSLHDECAAHNITFVFCGTGRRFVKDGNHRLFISIFL